MFGLEDIRKEYQRLDQLCGIDTSAISLAVSTRALKRRGACISKRGKPVKIAISDFVFEEPAKSFFDTIRHEYAHALVHIRSGKSHKHDRMWKKACVEVGCKADRFSAASEAQTEKIQKHAKYTIACQGCGNEFQRMKKTKLISLLEAGQKHPYHCARCNSKDFKLK